MPIVPTTIIMIEGYCGVCRVIHYPPVWARRRLFTDISSTPLAPKKKKTRMVPVLRDDE